MKEALLFLREAARFSRTTGTFAPSGTAVSRAMAAAVGDGTGGKVLIELGPGTGAFTRELTHRFPRHRVVAVEFIEAFARHLARTMPTVTVVTGCASQLDRHLNAIGVGRDDVAGVVSGLPLLTLPGDLSRRILASVTDVLKPGRRYVQITYSTRAWRRFETPGFVREPVRRVWRNLPPAAVMSFVKL
jgi:phosphatidylethanolamine/phosphatidyl-N-methylethanolamine N-methyltransferase